MRDCSRPSPRLPLQEETSGQERQTREMRGRISSSHCSPALVLSLNSEGLGGLCLGSQCHFHIHFMGKNIVITCVF